MKHLTTFFVVLTLLLVGTSAFSQGTLSYETFFSQALQENRAVGIYLPAGYSPGDATRYPVIYKLHPWFGNQATEWPILKPLLDTMIGTGQIQPVIVVTPNGYVGPYGGSVWTNSALYGHFDDFVAYDVVDFVDASYKTIPAVRKRALLGFSMGAIGSMTVGLGHPDIFGAVAAHSGYFSWDRIREDMRDAVLAENAGPPYNFVPGSLTYTTGLYLFSGGYSPNLANPPYYVDYPLDMNGDIVESVLDLWKMHDPAVLAAAQLPGPLPDLYFDCGEQDEFFMFETSEDLAAALDALGIPFVFRPYQGNHSLSAEKLHFSLTFLDQRMNDPAAVHEQPPAMKLRLGLQPNPLCRSAAVRFSTLSTQQTTLRVFDATGRLVETLFDAVSPAGDSEVSWEPDGLPAGRYFLELRSGSSRVARGAVVAH